MNEAEHKSPTRPDEVWSYELATEVTHSSSGPVYGGWQWKLGPTRPIVPEGSVRNLTRFLAETEPQPKGAADIEAAAQAVYALFEGADQYPWVPGGNSLKQDEARRYARVALEAVQAPALAQQPCGHVRIDSGEVHFVPKVRDADATELVDGQKLYAAQAPAPAHQEANPLSRWPRLRPSGRGVPSPAVVAGTTDAERLDYLQQRGATVHLIPAGKDDNGQMLHSFCIGGLHRAVSRDIREAIDAAISLVPVQGT